MSSRRTRRRWSVPRRRTARDLPRVRLSLTVLPCGRLVKMPFPHRARKTVDEVILVSTDEICAAIKDVFDDPHCRRSRPALWRLPASKACRS